MTTSLKVCVAQINTTPGDFSGNKDRIVKGIQCADEQSADLIIFPELTIPGYLSQDLIYNTEYIDRNLAILNELVAMSAETDSGLHTIIGYIDRNPEKTGKPFRNMAGVIHKGRLEHCYQKQLLPFYDVFDELRYFEPGHQTTVFSLNGFSIGLAICEDLWNDKNDDNYDYANNPLALYRDLSVDLIVSLNSSPFVKGKFQQRLKKIVPATVSGPGVIYVNQYGGQDELVFDGLSFIASDNRLLHLSTGLTSDTYEMVNVDRTGNPAAATILDNGLVSTGVARHEHSLSEMLVLGLRDYVHKSGFDQLVVASSGGVDSAVVCKLACDAIGAENVHAIRMPSMYSSDHARDDAMSLHTNLGCWDYEVPVDHQDTIAMLSSHYEIHNDERNLVRQKKLADGYAAVADENIQARLRDVYLMHFSNAYGAMPLATGNKTESGCGYYTHFDMNFSYAPIKDLYKFEVVDLARSDARIPVNIWQKPPSAELAFGQTDEASLLPYAVLDPIVMAYIEEYLTSFGKFCDWVKNCLADLPAPKITGDEALLTSWIETDGAPADYARIVSLIGRMEYKRRQTCPGTKVSKVAFGIGRRIPIVEKWS